jgi:GH24 family phage-related lysozyme (muramidase)
MATPIKLKDAAKHYGEEQHQAEAWDWLEGELKPAQLSGFQVRYRNDGAKPEAPSADQPALSNPLTVPYDCQLDNPSGDGWRECFSSSCAMAAMYWGVIKHQNEYHAVRPKYGDSTDPSAQIRTLQSFGLEARFVQVGSIEKLKAQIDRGRPAPVGFLHHGTVKAPSGGGHYILAIGYTDTHLIAHDPYGELDVVNGGYPKTGGTYGKEIQYSWKNWAPRWSVSNDHDGWGLDVWKPGVEVPASPKPEAGQEDPGLIPTATGAKGVALIKEFEGCRLDTYICPAGVPTCCVGHTGPEVRMGQTYTMSQCEELLRSDLERFEKAVRDLIDVPIDQCEFDALVSFAFNCGQGALADSTLRRRLNNRESKPKVFAEELPRWTSGGMAGLVRRRDAEVRLANDKVFP